MPAILAAIAFVVIGVVVASRGGWWRSNAASDAPGLTSNSSQLPIVVMMDSPHPSRVYDEEVIQLSGTNADVLKDLLRDLPIQRVKETAGPGWHRHEEIRRLDPAMRLSSSPFVRPLHPTPVTVSTSWPDSCPASSTGRFSSRSTRTSHVAGKKRITGQI